MRWAEIMTEAEVESSWISNITYNRPNRTLTLTLGDGKVYKVSRIPRTMYDKWRVSPSKGKFFHDAVKGKYPVSRLK